MGSSDRDAARAESHLERAAELDPEGPAAAAAAAALGSIALELRGDRAAAAAYFRRALRVETVRRAPLASPASVTRGGWVGERVVG